MGKEEGWGTDIARGRTENGGDTERRGLIILYNITQTEGGGDELV